MIRFVVTLLVLVCLCSTVSGFNLLNLSQWKSQDGGNDHWYGVLAENMFWDGAYNAARSINLCGQHGYLTTITSAAENSFVRDNVVVGTNQQSELDELFTGGYYQNGSWHWITGERFSYTNWNTGEPNNDPAVDESRVAMWGPALTPPPGSGQGPLGTWNNAMPDRYTFWSLVEFGGNYPISPVPPCAVPEPVTIVTFGLALGALMIVRRPKL